LWIKTIFYKFVKIKQLFKMNWIYFSICVILTLFVQVSGLVLTIRRKENDLMHLGCTLIWNKRSSTYKNIQNSMGKSWESQVDSAIAARSSIRFLYDLPAAKRESQLLFNHSLLHFRFQTLFFYGIFLRPFLISRRRVSRNFWKGWISR
jgi:hypothetical protein